MKVKAINIGNYQSIKVEINLEAEEGEKSAEVYQSAKDFIAKKEREILTENQK